MPKHLHSKYVAENLEALEKDLIGKNWRYSPVKLLLECWLRTVLFLLSQYRKTCIFLKPLLTSWVTPVFACCLRDQLFFSSFILTSDSLYACKGCFGLVCYLGHSILFSYNSTKPRDRFLSASLHRLAGLGIIYTLTGLLKGMVPSMPFSEGGRDSKLSFQVDLGILVDALLLLEL